MPLLFYHVGGYYSHVRRKAGHIPMSPIEMANALLGPKVDLKLKEDDILQFILGITPCGASYVLLSQYIVERNSQLRALFEGRPWSSDQFVSLSPVEFADAGALAAKLATMVNKRAKRGERRDRSPANTAFTTGSDSTVLEQAGIDRAGFEYHRVLYQLCKGTLSPDDYDARRVPWFGDMNTMWSFAYNRWDRDFRSLAEREQSPKVLDVGWTEYIPPSGSEGLYALGTKHFKVAENRLLQNPGAGTFLHGETSQASHTEISTSLQKIFTEAKRNSPIMLFVHDLKWALVVLKSFGVDTSEWRVGIEPVIGRRLLELQESRDSSRVSATPSYHERYRSGRSRSPGDRRSVKRDRSPIEQQKSPYPVYVVDVKNLYLALRQLSESSDNASVAAITHALQVKFEQPNIREESATANRTLPGWCAGNESRVLGYLWEAMASGNAIDEQRVARFDRIVHQTHLKQPDNKKPAVAASSSTSVPAPATRGGDDSDSDRDPNDFAPPASNSGPSTSVGRDPYASDEEDYYF